MVVLAAYCMILAHPGPIFYTGDVGPGAMEKQQDEEERRNAAGLAKE